MCGLIAVIPAYDGPPPVSGAPAVRAALASVEDSIVRVDSDESAAQFAARLDRLIDALRALIDIVTTPAVCRLLVTDNELRAEVADRAGALTAQLNSTSSLLDIDRPMWKADGIELIQTRLRHALDLTWTLQQDRLRAAERIRSMAGVDRSGMGGADDISLNATIAYSALDTALDALDRLEVRGRDSAGIHLWVRLNPEDLAAVAVDLPGRGHHLFPSGTIETVADGVSVVYKTAALIGRLGDNVRNLRDQIAEDVVLRRILSRPSARVLVLGHTRWASVGRVSEPNAHPLNSVVANERIGGRYVIGAVNGDVDNHIEITHREKLPNDPDITTDAKLIPVMMAKRIAGGATPTVAFHDCLRIARGSMAICVQTESEPNRLLVGIKGGGQGLYIGLSPVGYLVASEVFGLVSHATEYVRLEPDDPTAASDGFGVVASVDATGRGTLAGIARIDPTGQQRDVPKSAPRVPEVATRDVARGNHAHYLAKELAEAPSSFRKTLRGRIHGQPGSLTVNIPASGLPEAIVTDLCDGSIDELVFIGQGTAAVAASGVAHVAGSLLGGRLRVRSMPATEMSAWHLSPDMRHICVVAISQSGTTTDLNRTVDLVRERGARVLAIVNRRDSDLVGKSDGVFYTSDGRDIEMAVASTKAFYAQVAAGTLLTAGIAKHLGLLDSHAEDRLLHSLTEIPDKLEALDKANIAVVAERVACRYPYWAVLGSGPNRIAAAEVRIKLSELCYSAVSADAVEDMKHINLSAESLVLVCAAGTPATQIQDLVKEVDIFVAHRNQPVMIVDAGTKDLWSTDLRIEVPATHPILAWLLSTAAGHYFGYYAARAIDSAADELRLALAALDSAENGGSDVASARLGRFLQKAEAGDYRGVLGADIALALTKTHWLLDGALPVERLFAGTVDPHTTARDALKAAIDTLTRSIDSVKHQAKTVTVGTSRSGVELFANPLAKAIVELGADRETLSYSTLRALHDYAGVVADVLGATHYVVTGSDPDRQIRVIRKTGVASALPSRADDGTRLVGTKKLAVDTGNVRLERGLTDGRLVLIVPENSGTRVVGISLLHIELVDKTSVGALVAVLNHYGSRLSELRAAVTERDYPFVLEELATLGPEAALLRPVTSVAEELVG